MYFYKEVMVCLSHCTIENMIKSGGAVDEIQPHDPKLSSNQIVPFFFTARSVIFLNKELPATAIQQCLPISHNGLIVHGKMSSGY